MTRAWAGRRSSTRPAGPEAAPASEQCSRGQREALPPEFLLIHRVMLAVAGVRFVARTKSDIAPGRSEAGDDRESQRVVAVHRLDNVPGLLQRHCIAHYRLRPQDAALDQAEQLRIGHVRVAYAAHDLD